MKTSVAQIGIGAIGYIFAEHLSKAFDSVVLCDSDISKKKTADSLGLRFISKAAVAVQDVDYIVVSLPDPGASKAVFHGKASILKQARSGAVILDLSTIDPATARLNYNAAAEAGIHYVEAPISGGEPMSAGVDGAKNSNVTFMAGSDELSFQRAMPLMSILGEHPILLGPAGTGSIVKLISNYMSGLHVLIAAEAFALGKAAGISVDTMLKTFSHTDANSYVLLNYIAPRISSGSYEPGFSVDLQHKDLRLCEDIARELNVSMTLNNVGLSIYRMLQAQGRGGNDVVDAVNLMCELSGIHPYKTAVENTS